MTYKVRMVGTNLVRAPYKTKYPLREMKVGDGFDLKADDKVATVRARVYQFAAANKQKFQCVRNPEAEGGYTVVRIA